MVRLVPPPTPAQHCTGKISVLLLLCLVQTPPCSLHPNSLSSYAVQNRDHVILPPPKTAAPMTVCGGFSFPAAAVTFEIGVAVQTFACAAALFIHRDLVMKKLQLRQTDLVVNGTQSLEFTTCSPLTLPLALQLRACTSVWAGSLQVPGIASPIHWSQAQCLAGSCKKKKKCKCTFLTCKKCAFFYLFF